MADGYVYTLTCPDCGKDVKVRFGRRADDQETLRWKHDSCSSANMRGRGDDYIVTSLPTDGDGNLLPPE